MRAAWLLPIALAARGAELGTVEAGYRAILSERGSFNAYRTVVNLGEGPKLLGADLRLHNPKSKLFDAASLVMRNWGGDPYSTLQASLRKERLYSLVLDYRNLAHFNYLPSFANSAMDTRIGSTDVRLDLLPSRRVTPYAAYGRNTEQGGGVWLFSRQGNEYAVPMFTEHAGARYLGGVSFRIGWLHAFLEQGGTAFREDQGSSENVANPGSLSRPYLGRQLRLAGLSEEYRVRGNSSYSRGSLTVTPARWITAGGDFTYTNPSLDVTYTQASRGVFVIPQTLLPATGGFDSLRGSAQMPRPSGSLRAELRPWSRLRIVESWMTDRFHNVSSALLLEQYLTTGGASSFSSAASGLLVANYNRQQADAFLDITKSLVLHGGHRYEFGSASARSAHYFADALGSGELRRHVGLAGLAYRPAKTVRLNADFETGSTSQAYFRSSLRDYRKLRLRGAYTSKPDGTWRASLDYHWLDNENPDPSVRWDFASRAATANFEWFPKEGKRYSLLAGCTRSSAHSRIDILAPSTLRRERSSFAEAGSSGSLLVKTAQRGWDLQAGGTLYASTGSRPTRYYLPQARIGRSLAKSVAANAEWRWYSLGERFYRADNFGSHQLTISLVFEASTKR